MNNEIEYRPYIKIYWSVWLIFIVLSIFIRHFILQNNYENFRWTIFVIYALGSWLPVMGLNFYEYYRLREYLRKHHYAKWEHITSIPFFGSGHYNSFRSLPFVFGSDDLNDPNVKFLKGNYRRFIIFALTVFFAFPVMACLLL